MKLKLLFLLFCLNSAYQLNCMSRKTSFNVGVGATVLGFGSLAWQLYTQDYSWKKCLASGSLMIGGAGAFLWSYKKTTDLKKFKKMQQQAKKGPKGLMSFEEMQEQVKKLVNCFSVEFADQLTVAYGYDLIKSECARLGYDFSKMLIAHIRGTKLTPLSGFDVHNLGLVEFTKACFASESINYCEEFAVIFEKYKDTIKINQKDQNGLTSLHYAVQSDLYLPVVKLLIQQGAHVHAYDNQNRSVYDYALSCNAIQVMDYLKRTVMLNFLMGTNDREKVFSGKTFERLARQKARGIYKSYDDIEFVNSPEIARTCNKYIYKMAKNKDNARPLPIEIVEKIAELSLVG